MAGAASVQVPDTLTAGKTTLAVLDNMLASQYPEAQSDSLLFGRDSLCRRDDCLRGYRCRWTLRDSALYLTETLNPCYPQDTMKADLKTLFPERYEKGRVRATWMTGSIRMGYGACILPATETMEGVYAHEVTATFREGALTGWEESDNSRSRLTPLAHDADSLAAFLYRHTDWSRIHTEGHAVVQFTSDEQGRVIQERVLTSSDPSLDAPALDAIRAIPEWDILYKNGKFVALPVTLHLYFNEYYRSVYGMSAAVPN